MVIVREMDSDTFGKILLILYGTAGLVFGLFTTLAAFMGIRVPKRFGIFSLIFGKWAVFSLPVFYGISGYLIGRIAGDVYNKLVASKRGFRIRIYG
jgi:hypothetical protein